MIDLSGRCVIAFMRGSAHKAIIDRRRRTVLGRTIAPETAAFQHVHDAADHAAVVHPLDASYIRRQMRLNPRPLLIVQPKQVPAHDPNSLPKANQDRIVTAAHLMSSDPSLTGDRARIEYDCVRVGAKVQSEHAWTGQRPSSNYEQRLCFRPIAVAIAPPATAASGRRRPPRCDRRPYRFKSSPPSQLASSQPD